MNFDCVKRVSLLAFALSGTNAIGCTNSSHSERVVCESSGSVLPNDAPQVNPEAVETHADGGVSAADGAVVDALSVVLGDSGSMQARRHCYTDQGRAAQAAGVVTDGVVLQRTALWSQWLVAGAQRWEPTANGRDCRRWTVTRNDGAPLSGSLRVSRDYREAHSTRRVHQTNDSHFALRPECGELEVSGCTESRAFSDGTGTATATSDIGGNYQVAEVSESELRVAHPTGAMAWFSSRQACMRSSLRSNGPIVRCPR